MTFAIFFIQIINWWNKAKAESMEKAAVNNLMVINGAKWEWALSFNLDSNEIPTWDDLANFLFANPPFCDEKHGGFRLPKYPRNATYTIRRVADSPLCSYSGRTLALYGLSIHVKDVSVDDENGELYEFYLDKDKSEMRLAGSIVGASVAVEDKEGHWTNTVTDDEGMASVNTYQPVAIVVSKDEYLTSSNAIQDEYQYNYNISLHRKPK